MTKTEEETIRNIINRLNKPNCGCSHASWECPKEIERLNSVRIEAVSRLYLDTWIVPALEMLLPGENRNPQRAVNLSR